MIKYVFAGWEQSFGGGGSIYYFCGYVFWHEVAINGG